MGVVRHSCDACGVSLVFWRLIGSRIVCDGCEIVHRGVHAGYLSARRRGERISCGCVACAPVGGV